MDSTLPNSIYFKVVSFFLCIPPLNASNSKFILIIFINFIVLLLEVIMQFTLRKEIFAFVGKPVLMVLDSVSIIGPLLAHAILIFESLMKRGSDCTIWNQITKMDKKMGTASNSFDETYRKDFFLMTIIPLAVQIGVILSTSRTQINWALGLLSHLCSSAVSRWCILVFIYYMRYLSNRLSLMAQQIGHLNQLSKSYNYGCYVLVERLHQLRRNFHMIWQLHSLVMNRYEFFLTSYVFLSLCGLTASTYFLGTRLITRRLYYTIESVFCLVPMLYTHVHISRVTFDFNLKKEELLDALENLSEQNWRNSDAISASKLFKVVIKLANLNPTVGGHLRLDYSSLLLGVVFIITTYIFIFLFLN